MPVLNSIQNHGYNDQHPDENLLPIGGNTDQIQPVSQHPEYQRSQQGLPDSASASEQARTSDDHRGDNIQIGILHGDRLSGVDPAGQDYTG